MTLCILIGISNTEMKGECNFIIFFFFNESNFLFYHLLDVNSVANRGCLLPASVPFKIPTTALVSSGNI